MFKGIITYTDNTHPIDIEGNMSEHTMIKEDDYRGVTTLASMRNIENDGWIIMSCVLIDTDTDESINLLDVICSKCMDHKDSCICDNPFIS